MTRRYGPTDESVNGNLGLRHPGFKHGDLNRLLHLPEQQRVLEQPLHRLEQRVFQWQQLPEFHLTLGQMRRELWILPLLLQQAGAALATVC